MAKYRILHSEKGSVLAESALVTAFSIFTMLASLNLHFFIETYSKARSITYEIGRNASATPGMHLVNWEDGTNKQKRYVQNQAHSLFNGYNISSDSAEVMLSYNAETGFINVQTSILVTNFHRAFFVAPEAVTTAQYLYLIPVG